MLIGNFRIFFLGVLFLGFSSTGLWAAAAPTKTDVVVVGAGLSGMATAYALKKAGIPYHILEIAPRVGGRVRTVRYSRKEEPDLSADSGMEEYWESNPAVKILKELKLPITSDTALSSLMLEKKLYTLGDETPAEFKKKIFNESELKEVRKFQERVGLMIKQLSPERLPPAELLKLKDISFAEYLKSQNLPSKVSEWIRVSIECEIGSQAERISALDGIAEFHIFLGDGEACYRVEGGNDRFTEAFADSIGRQHLSLNKRVTRIVTKNDKVTVNYLDLDSNTNATIEAKHVVSTIPLYRLFEVQFEPALSAQKWQAIQSMGWGAYFKAHIFVPRSAEKYWTKAGASILPILSDSELGVIYDGNLTYTGKTKIISLLVHGAMADVYNMMPLDQVRAQIYAGFEKLWPGFTKEILDIEFYRIHPRAIAAWGPGRSRFDELSLAIRQPENRVYLAGDFTETSHSDGAFISAARVVKQIEALESKR